MTKKVLKKVMVALCNILFKPEVAGEKLISYLLIMLNKIRAEIWNFQTYVQFTMAEVNEYNWKVIKEL